MPGRGNGAILDQECKVSLRHRSIEAMSLRGRQVSLTVMPLSVVPIVIDFLGVEARSIIPPL